MFIVCRRTKFRMSGLSHSLFIAIKPKANHFFPRHLLGILHSIKNIAYAERAHFRDLLPHVISKC